MQRIKNSTASLTGITLYMQPVQDLTIEGTVSRTQYQFILQDADPAHLTEWTPKLVDKLNSCRSSPMWPATSRRRGCRCIVEIDRDQAARFGITPATIDNALYDSYGQRIVSTIFTNSNQYRVILEADPSLQTSLQSLSRHLSALVGRRHAGAARRDGQDAAANRAAAGLASRPVPVRHDLLQPGAGRLARRAR